MMQALRQGRGRRMLAGLMLMMVAGLAGCSKPAVAECEAGVADIGRLGTVTPPACP